jgi:hypothetical protein
MVSAYGTEEWANLSEEERQLSQRKMEVSPAIPLELSSASRAPV